MTGWLEVLLSILLTIFRGGWGSVAPEVPEPEASSPSVERTTHTVAYVIDGDTIVLKNGARVRLLGIDTPEQDECYYDKARDFVRDWLTGATVILERDVRNRDDYDRLLRYVFAETVPAGTATATPQLVNDILLKHGYATVLPIGDDRRYREQFYQSYNAAQAANRGRWSECAS